MSTNLYIIVDAKLNMARVSSEHSPDKNPFSTFVLHAAMAILHVQSRAWIKSKLDAADMKEVFTTPPENIALAQPVHLRSFKGNPGTRRPVGYFADNGFRCGLTSMGTHMRHTEPSDQPTSI